MRNLYSYNQAQKEVSEYPQFKEAVRVVEIDGHQIAWMKTTMQVENGEDIVFYDLCSEDALKGKIVEKNGVKGWEPEVSSYDQRHTIHANLASQLIIHEIREELKKRFKEENQTPFVSTKTPLWFTLKTAQKKKVVIELFNRHKQGEWIGQTEGDNSCLWSTPIADIFEIDQNELTELCLEMMKEKLIGISGIVITDWTSAYEPKEEPLNVKNKDLKPQGEEIEGITFFYSETGTEGGYWAIQDKSQITWQEPSYKLRHKQEVKQSSTGREGRIIEELWAEEDKQIEDTQWLVDFDGEKENISVKDLLVAKWSYSGMKVLKTGDWIEVFSDEEKTNSLWKGYIHLRTFPQFTEDANGMWIHSEQIGEKRHVWAQLFQEKHYVTLIPKQ